MDEKTVCLLNKWGLSSLVPTFKEQKIDHAALLSLSTTDIDSLLPYLGDRSKFRSQLKQYISQTTGVSELGVPLHEEDLLSFLGGVVAEGSSSKVIELNLGNQIDIEEIPGSPSVQSSDCVESESSASSSRVASVPPESVGTRGVKRPTESNAEIDPDDVPDNLRPKTPRLQQGLKEYLELLPEGLVILKQYDKCGMLDARGRKKLTEFAIRRELTGNPTTQLSREDFRRISAEIISLFPTETENIYYIPYVKLPDGTKRSAKGKLLDRYYHVRCSLVKAGIIAKDTQLEPQRVTASYDLIEKLAWLKNNLEPWETVKQYWKDTAAHRTSELQNTNGGNVAIYFDEYPPLRSPEGYTLVEIDFEQLYPAKANTLVTGWDTFAPKILKLAEREKSAAELLTQLSQPTLTSEQQTNLTLFLLPHLMGTHTRPKGRSKKQWRPSKLECVNGFILHVKTLPDLEKALNERREKLRALNLRMQPLVVAIGPSESSIEASYMCMDRWMYHLPTLLKAVEVCFKSFHTFHACYPKDSEAVWTLVQKAVYDLNTKWDSNIAAVNVLLSDLRALRAV